MKQRPRIYYTEAQKALMWDRWQSASHGLCTDAQTPEVLAYAFAIATARRPAHAGRFSSPWKPPQYVGSSLVQCSKRGFLRFIDLNPRFEDSSRQKYRINILL
jgi:hypothetical protein